MKKEKVRERKSEKEREGGKEGERERREKMFGVKSSCYSES